MKSESNICGPIQRAHRQPLTNFLNEWDSHYLMIARDISLFNRSLTQQWAHEQVVYFIKVFYHSRGHFRDFLWHLGNFAPNKAAKAIILENIQEEFNGNDLSHEQLYLDFAKSYGVDLSQEILEEETYLPEMKAFNKSHIYWLHTHGWTSNFSAFSAYERLDTIDYKLLSGITGTKHRFFELHKKAKHFDWTYDTLGNIWAEKPDEVKNAFTFIAQTQVQMWKDLSNAVFKHKSKEAS